MIEVNFIELMKISIWIVPQGILGCVCWISSFIFYTMVILHVDYFIFSTRNNKFCQFMINIKLNFTNYRCESKINWILVVGKLMWWFKYGFICQIEKLEWNETLFDIVVYVNLKFIIHYKFLTFFTHESLRKIFGQHYNIL